ncbi:hypothetical protein A4G19_07030 [Pasteurellaceae bacterium Macca]|nr:hypothetical protein [Pasteurellaceae bacterium Macca]
MGRVDFSSPKGDACEEAFDLLQAKIPAHRQPWLHHIQRQGFQFVEGEMLFRLPLTNCAKKTTACHRAIEAEIPELCDLFGGAFPHSRWRAPWFSQGENQRFYQQWISNAVLGRFDDLCLVKKIAGQIVGGVSLRVRNEEATLGLLAVSPTQRGKGIACELLAMAQHYSVTQGAKWLNIATQTQNLLAIRLYQSFGAEIHHIHYWFYR